MIALAGSLGLALAALAAAGAGVACFATGGGPGRGVLKAARMSLGASAVGFLTASLALGWAFLQSDLRFAYVAAHTERSLSPLMRVAAAWSGQEGSLLLWATLTSCVGALFVGTRRRACGPGEATTLGALSVLGTFLALVILFGADPFAGAPYIPEDGAGLSPQLQYWAMIVHPPVLFTGYALAAIPCAITLGALATGRTDDSWVGEMRRWAIAAWLFVGAGITLGAWWAYVELGWGGYWAWDPVENTSLVPWLACTALLHSIIVHQHRGLLKRWTSALAILTFTLCLAATFITRSGAIQSIHAFAASGVGWSFLGLLAILLGVGTALLVRRRSALAPPSPLPSAGGREAFTLAGNVLFTAMALVTLGGTLVPLITGLLSRDALGTAPSFYHRVVAPLMLAATLLMALSPLLVYGPGAGAVLARRARIPGAAACLGVLVAFITGLHNPVALLCVAVTIVTIVAAGRSLAFDARHHGSSTGDGRVASVLRVIDSNHRRYGGLVAHLGVALLAVGVIGSSLFSASVTATLRVGESLGVGRFQLRLEGIEPARGENYTGSVAVLALTAPSGAERTLRPERRYYEKAGQTTQEVALHPTWREDVYVALAGCEGTGRDARVAVLARINPMMLWIWAGACTMGAGGVLSLLPRLLPRASPVASTEARPRPELPLGTAHAH